MNKAGNFDAFKRRIRIGVEEHLVRVFSKYPDTEVSRVAKYAVMGGGHRWRPILAVAAGEIFHHDAFHICMPGACGVELVHAASLLLDDLPSTDNAQVRHGKPCAHLVFPRWAVDMAPAFLVNMSYAISLDNPMVSYERRVTAALEVSQAGLDMSEGQEIDITQPIEDDDHLLRCYRLKTGALYAAAAKADAILCGANKDEALLLYECGMNLGLSYQFLDDVADVVAGVEETGKDSGMDADKRTAVDLFGIDGAKARVGRFKQDTLSKLKQFGPEADRLRSLVRDASWAPI
jgi:geranylgeranyl pyrophosphate synthase